MDDNPSQARGLEDASRELKRRADSLEQDSDELQQRGDELERQTEAVLRDWDSKRADPNVPGAPPHRDGGAGGDSPEARERGSERN